ncbi:MAG TPA: hypothetical protein VF111_15645 [Thermoanaerobaculia bacterium]
MAYIEAVMLLCPTAAGGRTTAVEPREGSYQPFVRDEERLVRVRVIEGPPRLYPGDAARVVLESESLLDVASDLPLIEPGVESVHIVGSVTILRVWRGAIAV